MNIWPIIYLQNKTGYFIDIKLHGGTEFVDNVEHPTHKLMSQILTIHKIIFKQFDVNFEYL